MRRVLAGLFMTVDGVCEDPGNWSMPYFNEQVGEIITANMQASDAMLLGRRTYEEFAAYWPTVDSGTDPFAGFLNKTRKLVASNTLTTLQWGPAELISGDVVKAVADLKRKPGGDLIILGSPTLVGALLRTGVLDVLEPFVVPGPDREWQAPL